MFDPRSPDCVRDAIERYKDKQADFERLGEYLQAVLKRIAKDLYVYPIVMGRAKSLESFAEKIQRPGKSYTDDPLTELTDLCGVRVITHTLDEVDAMAEKVQRRFVIDLDNSEDKRKKLAPSEFGYLSNHFIIQLRPDEVPQVDGFSAEEVERLKPLKAELQLRTLAQHLWADVYHELGYKNEFQLPDRWKREFMRMAALLESCDKAFQEIKDAMRNYESNYSNYMTPEQLAALARRLEAVLRVQPDSATLLHRLIKTHLALGHGHRIQEILERHGAALAAYPPALRDIGVAYSKARNLGTPAYDEGLDFLRRAIAANPRDVDAICCLGGAYRRQGRREDARNCYRQAHEIDPSDPYALGNYIAEELMIKGDEGVIRYFHAALRGAVQRCRLQVEVKVNLPWALFDLGIFHVYLGDTQAALSYYSAGIAAATDAWMIASANGPVADLLARPVRLAGLPLVDRLLKLAWWTKATSEERELSAWKPSPGPVPLTGPVAILAGGCGGLESLFKPKLPALKAALKTFRGTLVSGGTRSGIAEIPGDIVEECGDAGPRAVGYLPAGLPEGVLPDLRIPLRRSGGLDFSPLEPLTFWEDFLAAGGDPKTLRLVGFNGGPIAAFEFRIALALGAKVGIVKESGRSADEMLSDPLWRDRLVDGPAPSPGRNLHSLDVARGEAEKFFEE